MNESHKSLLFTQQKQKKQKKHFDHDIVEGINIK